MFREFTKVCLGSKYAWKIKNLSPWSYPDAAAAGAAADAASAAASAVCILSCTSTGARSAPLELRNLRVLGPPNPVQSFGRGLWGPQATEAWSGRAEVEWLKRQ